MSADNWTICPKCYVKLQQKKVDDAHAVADLYGKVDAQAYLKAVSDHNQTDYTPRQTCREDYQIGMDHDAVFHVIYKCGCSECDFKFDFKVAIPNCDKIKRGS